MLLQDLNGKSVCILGYGREGKAMLDAIKEYAPEARVTIADQNTELRVTSYGLQVGDKYLENLDRFDVIVKSPGIPPNILGTRNSELGTITNSTQIFLEEAAARGATVIGVTGSKGKSTTASLIYAMLQAHQQPATRNPQPYLVGNIGEPAIAHLKDIKLNTIFVQEMSSYQLMDCTVSPHIAVITSFFPEHLDYHGSLQNYQEAKSHITQFQTENDFVVYDAQSPGAEEIALKSSGRRIAAHTEDLPLVTADLLLKGEHNLRNAAIAFLTTRLLGVPERISIPVIQNFKGLPHRLQSLGIHNEIEWVDDAISTTPESTIAALDALGDRVSVIILGGQDRGNDFTALGKYIAKSKIHTVILFPGSGPRIRTAIEGSKASVKFFEAETMQEAVTNAKFSILNSQFSIPSIVLLSTASPSYGMFRNFEEKGDAFKKCIQDMSILT